MKNNNYDVAIIGGGIIGTSIAAHLASEKIKTILINSDKLGMPASIAAAGLLTPFQLTELGNPILKDFCFKSFDYFEHFLQLIQEKSKINCGYNKPGSLYLIFSNFEFGSKETEIRELKNIDTQITFVNKQDIQKYEPQVTKEIVGAYYFPREGYINNPKFLKAIFNYIIENKIEIKNKIVREIKYTNNQIDNITLEDDEEIHAKYYVISNGTWANKLLNQVFHFKENLIKGIKGEILQILPVQNTHFEYNPLQKIIFCKDGYILPRPATSSFEQFSILIGSTSCEVDPDCDLSCFSTTLEALSSLSTLAEKLLPNIKKSIVLNHWAGIRPKTPDLLPIIGSSGEIKNLFLALGHYRNGILMGPYTGKIIFDLITKNQTEYTIKGFNLERFLKKAVKAKS